MKHPSRTGPWALVCAALGLPCALLASGNPNPVSTAAPVVHVAALAGPGQSGPFSSAHVLKLYPASLPPGFMVRISTDQPVFDGRVAPKVMIGDQEVPFRMAMDSPTDAEALVPNLPPGQAKVMVVVPNQKRQGRSKSLKILAATSHRLVLRWKNNQLELLDARAVGDDCTRLPEQDLRRLSFDVFNKRGDMIYTGAIQHPAARLEAFEDPQTQPRAEIHGEPSLDEDVMFLKVPNVPGGFMVKFYDTPAHLNLEDRAQREQRQFLSEFRIGMRGQR